MEDKPFEIPQSDKNQNEKNKESQYGISLKDQIS